MPFKALALLDAVQAMLPEAAPLSALLRMLTSASVAAVDESTRGLPSREPLERTPRGSLALALPSPTSHSIQSGRRRVCRGLYAAASATFRGHVGRSEEQLIKPAGINVRSSSCGNSDVCTFPSRS